MLKTKACTRKEEKIKEKLNVIMLRIFSSIDVAYTKCVGDEMNSMNAEGRQRLAWHIIE